MNDLAQFQPAFNGNISNITKSLRGTSILWLCPRPEMITMLARGVEKRLYFYRQHEGRMPTPVQQFPFPVMQL
jgi:hypothetical protein